MSAVLLGLPLLVALVVLALYPWRSRTMAFVGPGMALIASVWWGLHFDDVGTWLVAAGPPTAVALIGLGASVDRFRRRR